MSRREFFVVALDIDGVLQNNQHVFDSKSSAQAKNDWNGGEALWKDGLAAIQKESKSMSSSLSDIEMTPIFGVISSRPRMSLQLCDEQPIKVASALKDYLFIYYPDGTKTHLVTDTHFYVHHVDRLVKVNLKTKEIAPADDLKENAVVPFYLTAISLDNDASVEKTTEKILEGIQLKYPVFNNPPEKTTQKFLLGNAIIECHVTASDEYRIIKQAGKSVFSLYKHICLAHLGLGLGLSDRKRAYLVDDDKVFQKQVSDAGFSIIDASALFPQPTEDETSEVKAERETIIADTEESRKKRAQLATTVVENMKITVISHMKKVAATLRANSSSVSKVLLFPKEGALSSELKAEFSPVSGISPSPQNSAAGS